MVNAPTLLQILPALDSGGVERGTIEIAKTVAEQGWRSLVGSCGGGLEPMLAHVGGEHFQLPAHSKDPWQIFRNISRIETLIRRENVSLVHARSRAPAWAAYYAAKRCGVPFVTTFHGFYSMEGLFKQRYNSIMTRGKKVIAISGFIRDYILRSYPNCPASRIEVIHRGADLELFSPSAVTPGILGELSSKWQLNEVSCPIILMPGRLTRIKGHSLLIKALSRIRDRNFMALIVGSDNGREDFRQSLEDKARRAGLQERVRFVGKTRQMTEAYALSDIVVVPTIVPEAFGRVPVEAQAMGKIVVAADHGGMQETIRHNKTGFLVEPGNDEALARQLLAALQMNEQQRAQMSAAAIAHVQQHFSIAQMQAKTLELYRGLL